MADVEDQDKAARKRSAQGKAPSAAAAVPASHAALARKYRPKTFAELIGQEAMVRTLTKAFASGRIAQAYMPTGGRGVGMTPTAGLMPRALNNQHPASKGRPST